MSVEKRVFISRGSLRKHTSGYIHFNCQNILNAILKILISFSLNIFILNLKYCQLAAGGHAGQCWRSSRSGSYVHGTEAWWGETIGNFDCVVQEALLGRQLVVPLLTRHAAQKGWLVSICREIMETIQAMKFNPFPKLLPSNPNASPNTECRTSAVSV